MLPFLKQRKQESGIATEYRAPDQEKSISEEDHGLEAAAADLAKGIQNNDRKLIVSALKAAFDILDSLPHVEGEHIESKEE